MACLDSLRVRFKLRRLLSLDDEDVTVSLSVYIVDSELPAEEVASLTKAPINSFVVAFVGWRVCAFLALDS